MVTNRQHNPFPIQIIKETFDVQIDHPVLPPTPLTGDADRIQRGLAGTIPIRIRMKIRLHLRFENHLYHRLGYPIRNGRNAQRTGRSPVALRDLD